ncbi:hypothetical protein M5689_012159 [Euphorbia peplus]|nr:hypothetical protein M5689_012159 [Euphorbia peplus]
MSLKYIMRTCWRAIQEFKDRNSKRLVRFSRQNIKSESDDSDRLRFVSGAPPAAAKGLKETTTIRSRREAEKSEYVMHLICWGPNNYLGVLNLLSRYPFSPSDTFNGPV